MSQWAEVWGYEGGTPVDRDRGVTGRMPESGASFVWMYKDMPGLYLWNNGAEAPDEAAEAAGFDLARDRAEAQIRMKIKVESAKIREDAERLEKSVRAEVEAELTDDNPFDPVVEKVNDHLVTERNAKGDPRGTADFSMVHRGGAFWDVVDRASQEVVHERSKTKKAIEQMLDLQANRESA